MAWFDWLSGGGQKDNNPPARQDRQKCWESRDAYFACLDKAEIVIPGKEGKECSSFKKNYENDCAKSWIEYFNQRRVLAEKQKGTLAIANMQAEEAKRKGKL